MAATTEEISEKMKMISNISNKNFYRATKAPGCLRILSGRVVCDRKKEELIGNDLRRCCRDVVVMETFFSNNACSATVMAERDYSTLRQMRNER